MIEFIVFILIYIVSKYISNYTILTKYQWFLNIQTRVIFIEKPNVKKILTFFINSKITNCASCNLFWVAFLIGLFVSFFVPYNYVVFGLFSYFLHKTNE